ncbi:MAG: hypothetical protein ACTS2F_22885 [Thainema sp.]
MTEYFTCPVCGTDVPLKARACPECGSDKGTGWSEAAQYAHLLPDRGEEGYAKQPAWRAYMIPIAALVCLSGFLMAAGLFWAAILVPLVVAAVRLVMWFMSRLGNTNRGLERQAYQQLVRRAAGDHSMADRLIEFERKRTPEATRLQLIQSAIFRWDRDR